MKMDLYILGQSVVSSAEDKAVHPSFVMSFCIEGRDTPLTPSYVPEAYGLPPLLVSVSIQMDAPLGRGKAR